MDSFSTLQMVLKHACDSCFGDMERTKCYSTGGAIALQVRAGRGQAGLLFQCSSEIWEKSRIDTRLLGSREVAHYRATGAS